MTASRLDITIEQGTDYDTPFTFDFDLTGYSAFMQIRKASGYPYPVLSLTSLAGGLLIDPSARTVLPVIPETVSAAINAGRYVYDLKLVSPSGKHSRPYRGDAYVSAEVTDNDETSTITSWDAGGNWDGGLSWAAVGSIANWDAGRDWDNGLTWAVSETYDSGLLWDNSTGTWI